MSLDKLRKFATVAESGSISRAAARMNMAQPTLSRTIRTLEAEHQVELFTRHGEGVTLTEPGKVLYARCQEIFNQYDRANEEIAQLKGRNKASLRIAAGDLWGYWLLPPVIKAFLRQQDNVMIQLEIVDHARRLDGLRNGTYDVVFGIIDPSIESFLALNFVRMAAEGFSVYADRNHPLASRDTLREADLRAFPWVNHKFEFGLFDSGAIPDTRDYALKVNTLLNTVQIMRGTDLLISASSGFTEMFREFGLVEICTDQSRPVLPSGAIHWGSLDEKPDFRRFVRMAKSHVTASRQGKATGRE